MAFDQIMEVTHPMRVAGVLALVLATTGVVLRDCVKCQARTRNRPMEYFHGPDLPTA